MNSLEHLSLNAREVLRRIEQNRAVWIAPAVICGLLALVASFVTPRPWEATQAVVVRQEASASRSRPGKFADLYEMRTLQETILELAKSRSVVVATLQAVETAESGVPASAPTDAEIDEFREALSMLPPKGAEFGKTEVFYLNVKDRNRARALALVDNLCDQLDIRLKALRNEQAEGLITELKQQIAMAGKMQETETERLAAYEAEVGADLGELRMLNTNSSGQSDLRQQYVALENNARRTQA